MLFRVKELFRRRFGNIHFFADGDGDGGGGDGGGETPEWHSDFPCLADNPEASKAMSKYKTADAGMSAAYEAQKKIGLPFWLPDDHSKLTDDQKNEIRANVAKMEGLPETADGYVLKVKEGSKTTVDDLGMAEFKVFCKENHISNETAQKLLDFQTGFTDRVSAAFMANEAQKIKDRNVEISKQFSIDCGGEAQQVLRREQIKTLLQSMCKDADDKPDPKMWEDFEKQYDEKGVDLVLLRALSKPALAAAEGGTGAAGGSGYGSAKPASDYAEMRGKNK